MNAFLGDGFCQDEINHGDCLFDFFDCCESPVILPGDTSFCTECLCKGMHKFSLLKLTQGDSNTVSSIS
jgi:hypothetical protein